MRVAALFLVVGSACAFSDALQQENLSQSLRQLSTTDERRSVTFLANADGGGTNNGGTNNGGTNNGGTNNGGTNNGGTNNGGTNNGGTNNGGTNNGGTNNGGTNNGGTNNGGTTTVSPTLPVPINNPPPPPACRWMDGLCKLTKPVNALTLVDTDCAVTVPVPVDNYVDDRRINKYDDNAHKQASARPYIQLSSKLHGSTGPAQQSQVSSWLQYETSASEVQDDISFARPGLYDTSIVAKDYAYEATCDGCVAVQDLYRPRFGGTCPAAPTSPQTLSETSFGDVQAYEDLYIAHVDATNVVNNPNSRESCNVVVASHKNFYGSSEPCATKCFDESALTTNLNKLKQSTGFKNTAKLYAPLNTELEASCKWSCSKAKTLKENFFPYVCTPGPYDTQEQTCEELEDSDAHKCSLSATLEAKGADIIDASVSINGAIKAASQHVVAAMAVPPASPNFDTEVYYAVSCDSTPANCPYTATLSDLLSSTQAFHAGFPARTNAVSDFVFWRYVIEGVAKEWTRESSITFDRRTSVVSVEAWTPCGRTHVFQFTVHLIVHSKLECEGFSPHLVDTAKTPWQENIYCAHAESEFAVLNLDVDVTEIMNHVDEKVKGTYTGATCTVVVKETGGADTTPAQLFAGDTSATLDKYYALELVNQPTTASTTTATVVCTFTRTAHVNTVLLGDEAAAEDPHSITCTTPFVIADCDAPRIDPDGQLDTCVEECAGKSTPGVHEACGGSIVSSTAFATVLSQGSDTCCTECNARLDCNAVSSTDVKRCEISSRPLLLAELAADEQSSYAGTGTTTMALLGASAMVALVALVAVKRRANAAARVTGDEDAYYPLLE